MKLPIRYDYSGRRYRLLSSLAAFGLVALLAANAPRPLSAADVSWLSAVDGDWADVTKWSSDPSLPGTADNVTIAATTSGTDPYTVTFGTTADIRSLVLGNLSAPRATLSIASGTFTIDRGNTNDPAFSLTNSSLSIASGATVYVRAGNGSSNQERGLVLNGNADVTVNGSLYVQRSSEVTTGSAGAGLLMTGTSGQTNTFTLNSGAVANFGYTFIGNAGNQGSNHVTVDGGTLSLRALTLGASGSTTSYNNTLTIKNGGTFTTGATGIGGATGNAGNGELILEDGTATITGNLTLGTFGSSTSSSWINAGTGRVTIKSGTFTVNLGDITLGGGNDFEHNQASGIINLEGGTFTTNPADGAARTITLSATSWGSGTINISGNGVMNLASNAGNNTLRLAPSTTFRDTGTGAATLNLSDHGTLNVDKLEATTAASSIHFTGGLFTVKQATVSNGEAFTVGNGSDTATLRLVTATGSGDHIFADGLVISSNARLEGSGKIVTGLASVSGTLAASGTLEFADGLTLFDGSTIDLNNISGSLFVSGGDLTIADGATINIRLADFTNGDPVTLFTASASIAGTALDNVNFLFNGVATSGTWDGTAFRIVATAIPEPAYVAALLAAAGLILTAFRRR